MILILNHLKTNFRRFLIKLAFEQTRFKDITQVREFTLDALIGTCGGYIGMLLGYALIQLPQFFQFIFAKIQKGILLRKTKQSARNVINHDVIYLV